MRCTHGLGADNDKLHTRIEINLHGLLVADSAANLYRQIRKGLGNGLDRPGIDRLAGKCAVKVHHVQAPRTGINPALRDLDRIVTENRFIFHASLPSGAHSDHP